VTIVMCDEDGQDPPEMLFVQNQQPVKALGQNGAHEALRRAVLLGKTEGQGVNVTSNRRTTNSPRECPRLRHQTSMPPEQHRRRDAQGPPLGP
jgi:hypothetical protein